MGGLCPAAQEPGKGGVCGEGVARQQPHSFYSGSLYCGTPGPLPRRGVVGQGHFQARPLKAWKIEEWLLPLLVWRRQGLRKRAAHVVILGSAPLNPRLVSQVSVERHW